MRVQVIEDSKSEAFMTAKVDDPEAKRIQMAEQIRKSKKKDIISKRRAELGAEPDPPGRGRIL